MRKAHPRTKTTETQIRTKIYNKVDGTSQNLDNARYREIARLRARELETISSILRDFEASAPVTAEGIHGTAILEGALALLQASAPHLPFFVGIHPVEPPAPEFEGGR